MSRKGRKPATAPKSGPPPAKGRSRAVNQRPANPLVQPDARWQRTQRYVWDKKR